MRCGDCVALNELHSSIPAFVPSLYGQYACVLIGLSFLHCSIPAFVFVPQRTKGAMARPRDEARRGSWHVQTIVSEKQVKSLINGN